MVCINASLQLVCPASPVSKHHPFLLQLLMKIICLAGAKIQHETCVTSTWIKSCCQQWGLQDLSRSGKMRPYLYRPATQAIKSREGPCPPRKKNNPTRLGWAHFCFVKTEWRFGQEVLWHFCIEEYPANATNFLMGVTVQRGLWRVHMGVGLNWLRCVFDALNRTSL